jgi:hypothetical protein
LHVIRKHLSYIAAGAFWIATGVLAAEPPAAQAPAQTSTSTEATQPPAVVDDPVICRKESPTGSRIATMKTCLKRSEWQAKSKRRSRKFEDPSQMDCGAASCETTPLPSGSG